MRGWIVGLVLVACNGPSVDEPTDETDSSTVDADGDGFAADVDCDDDNADINPDADELCNGVDDDCDDAIDNDAIDAVEVWTDADADGYGDPDTGRIVCLAEADEVDNDGDCADDDPAINPDATEVCDADNVDEDCDGFADDADDSVDLATGGLFYRDSDGDGFGDPRATVRACDAGDGRTADNTDCDDTDPDANPRDGCPGPWDGEWDTTITFDIAVPELGVSIECEATGVLDIDAAAREQVDPGGAWRCRTPDDAAALTITGAFTDADTIAGDMDLEGEVFTYEADFSGDSLNGSGTDRRTIEGLDYVISHTITGARR